MPRALMAATTIASDRTISCSEGCVSRCSHTIKSVGMVRYVCIGFETNGFAPKGPATYAELPLPFSNFPIQLSVDVVDSDGHVEHAYDTIIAGARQLCLWVVTNVPITMNMVLDGKPFSRVIDDLAGLLQEGDTIVAHDIAFDIGLVLSRTCDKLGVSTLAARRVLSVPRFCTMKCSYSKSVFGRWPKLKNLCEHFAIELDCAHDARHDSAALAQCVSVAIRRGVMLDGADAIGQHSLS